MEIFIAFLRKLPLPEISAAQGKNFINLVTKTTKNAVSGKPNFIRRNNENFIINIRRNGAWLNFFGV